MEWTLEELIEAMCIDSQEDYDDELLDYFPEEKMMLGKRNLEKIQVIYSGHPSDRGVIIHSCGMELMIPCIEENPPFVLTCMDTGELLFINYILN